MRSFHTVFLEALRFAVGSSPDVDNLSEISEAELLLPASESGAYRKQESRRALKGVQWIESPDSHFNLMLLLLLGSAIMEMHFAFFKHASQARWSGDKSYIFNLCDMSKSKALVVLAKLANLVTSDQGWGPMETTFGPSGSWPARYKQLAREGILMMYGQLWRRLVRCWQEWPWPLVAIADPEVSMVVKKRVAEKLFAMPIDSLDPASRKIRQKSGSAELILTTWWLAFLYHCFNKVVISTSFVECLFAAFNQWISVIPKPISATLVCAKHVLSSFKRSQTDMIRRAAQRENATQQVIPQLSPVSQKRKRPEWVIKGGEAGRQNSYGEFIGRTISARPVDESGAAAFKRAVTQWGVMPREARAKYKAGAKSARLSAQTNKLVQLAAVNAKSVDAPSPWGLSRGSDRFPLLEQDVRTQLHQKALTHIVLSYTSYHT
jgi:hypothetical protein